MENIKLKINKTMSVEVVTEYELKDIGSFNKKELLKQIEDCGDDINEVEELIINSGFVLNYENNCEYDNNNFISGELEIGEDITPIEV